MAIKAASADRFEPNSELKNWWLNTRKNKIRIGNVELNGMLILMVLQLMG